MVSRGVQVTSTELTEGETEWDNRTIRYSIIRRPRKSLTVTVYRDLRVIVRAPRSVSLREINDYVLARRAWILKHLTRFEALPPDETPTFQSGENHLFLGVGYPLRVEQGRRRGVALESGQLLVGVGPATGPRAVRLALRRWYTRQARPEFERRLAQLQRDVPLFAALRYTLRVRHMNRRWGSCSSRNVITMNPLLVQAPPECVDYVLAHELVHLVEFGHTKRFYEILSRVMPDWKEREAVLKETPVRS